MQETSGEAKEKDALNPAQKREERERRLHANLREKKETLDAIVQGFESSDFTEHYYRWYHHSFKAYRVQGHTKEAQEFIFSFHPELELGFNKDLVEILKAGTDVKFDMMHNQAWAFSTIPMFTAAEHCRIITQAMQKCVVREPDALVTGLLSEEWALVLYVYNMR